MLQAIRAADRELADQYDGILVVNPDLNRRMVSFQANKQESETRWCKYKEGFSAALMHYLFDREGLDSGHILDPFAGSGTALFVASELGIDSTGIELLPNAAEIIRVRSLLRGSSRLDMAAGLDSFRISRIWEEDRDVHPFPHLAITSGAFPSETEHLLGRYLHEVSCLMDSALSRVLRFAVLCVLEDISYTRKDGQYLRWDSRSGRRAGGKQFNKGPIRGFTEAVSTKLSEIAEDLRQQEAGWPRTLFDSWAEKPQRGEVTLLEGSCLEVLPSLETRQFSGLVTSPPYCNRYDYTRTYALELAMLGVDEAAIKSLRQTMLTCTVENREKQHLKDGHSTRLYNRAMATFSSHELLSRVLAYLDLCRDERTINNTGIPRMVRNYFREMALVIYESARVLRPGAPLVMVNDNVRYEGAHVPVDLILSDFARAAGFDVERIHVLPRGKGNSSQQMGAHGRQELRKCVYVWRRRRATKKGGRGIVGKVRSARSP